MVITSVTINCDCNFQTAYILQTKLIACSDFVHPWFLPLEHMKTYSQRASISGLSEHSPLLERLINGGFGILEVDELPSARLAFVPILRGTFMEFLLTPGCLTLLGMNEIAWFNRGEMERCLNCWRSIVSDADEIHKITFHRWGVLIP